MKKPHQPFVSRTYYSRHMQINQLCFLLWSIWQSWVKFYLKVFLKCMTCFNLLICCFLLINIGFIILELTEDWRLIYRKYHAAMTACTHNVTYWVLGDHLILQCEWRLLTLAVRSCVNFANIFVFMRPSMTRTDEDWRGKKKSHYNNNVHARFSTLLAPL